MMNASDWDKRYSEKPRLWVAEPDRGLVEWVETLAPGRAVDLGAGEGRNTFFLASRGWQVTAVEFSTVAVERMRDRASENVAVLQRDVFEYLREGPLDADLVVAAYLHFPPPEREDLFGLLGAALRPGARLCLIGHHLDSLGHAGPPDAARLWTENDLEKAFPEFAIVKMEKRMEGSDAGHGDAPVLVAWLVRK